MYEFLFRDERGVVTVDWVALTAGIMILGIMVAYAVMSNSADYLIEDFETLNEQYSANADQVVIAVQQTNLNP